MLKRGRKTRSEKTGLFSCLLIMVTLIFSTHALAINQPSPLSEKDCALLLEDPSITPKSITPELLESCSAIPDIAPAAGVAAAASDPCSGPQSAGSVYCWGPWTALSPAAGGNPNAPVVFSEEQPRPELSNVYDPDVVPDLDLPLEGCAPGSTSCGFATVVEGSSGTDDADNTEIVNFALAADGSSFTVAPGTNEEVTSVEDMSTNFAPQGGELYILDSLGIEADQDGVQVSQLQSRVKSADGSTVQYGADYWGNASQDNSGTTVNSGNYAWGSATGVNDLEALNNLGGSVGFSGVMSGDNTTTANVTLNYDGSNTWTSSFAGGYNFIAGGDMVGVDFISDPAQFSANVTDGYVQGVALGPLGDQAVAIAVDVILNSGGVTDVGLLPQVTP